MEHFEKLVEEFCVKAKLVALETLLEQEEWIEESFGHVTQAYEDAVAVWSARNSYTSYSKDSLLTVARQNDIDVKASLPKEKVLGTVIKGLWSKTDTYEHYVRARDEADRIRRWAKRLQEVPHNLRELITHAEAFYTERWLKSQEKSLWEAASAVRRDGLELMDLEWAATRARYALELLEKDTTLADLVLKLASDVQMAVMGLIPTNLSASGVGVQHMAYLGGAKLLTRTFYQAVPEQARPFLSTVYN